MKDKKWVALLLIGIMVITMTACGAKTEKTDPVATEITEGEKAEETKEGDTTEESKTEESTTEESTTEVTTNYGGTLKIGLQNDITHLGYAQGGLGSTEALILDTSCEHLCRYAADGTLTPWLSTGYEEDPDNLTLTVHLRENIKFHDGSNFNADAVVWNWEEWTRAGNIELKGVDNYEVIDDHTIVVHLKEWSNSIATACLYTAGIMVSAEYAKANGTDALDKNPVGTGAFKFVKWDVDQKIVFEANEDYWMEGLPYLDGIEFNIIPDEAAQISAFHTGEIDFLLNCNSDASRTLKEAGFKPEAKSLISGGLSFMFWFSAQDEGPMGNVDVRRAISSAIDKDVIVNYIQGISGAVIERTPQWGPNDVWSTSPNLKGYPYNPEAAKEYLKAAGYPDGFDMILYYGSGGDDEEICLLAQGYLAEVGINAKMELIDSTITNELSGINGESFNGMIFSAGRAEVDLTTYYNRTFLPDGVRWVNQVTHEDEIINLIKQATTSKTFEEKEKYCQELSRVVIDDYCELMPLYISSDTIFTHEDVIDHGIYQINAIIWTPESAYFSK